MKVEQELSLSSHLYEMKFALVFTLWLFAFAAKVNQALMQILLQILGGKMLTTNVLPL